MEEKAGATPPALAEATAPPPAEALAEGPRRRGGAPKRKAAASPSPSAASKRLAKERNAIPQHLLPHVHNGPCTRARQSPNKLGAAAADQQKLPEPFTGASASADGGVKGAPAAAGDAVEAEEEGLAEEPVVDVEFDAIRTRGTGVHVVPTPAGWFSWRRIHPIEKYTLASFFNGRSGDRTPDMYMEIRNSVMKKFHADPQTQVELKDLEVLTAGDLDARREVMEFLDHWGLINFHPLPPSNPNLTAPDMSETPDGDGVDKTSSLVEKLFQFEAVQLGPRSLLTKPNLAAPPVAPRFLHEPIIADELVKSKGPSVEYHCNSCSADCSRKRYHCQKQADFDLCTECYNNGKFGSGMAPTDFILMEPAEVPGVSGGSWTDQETLLLLEALELFGENWNEIAEHVATKTKAQCILHFLEMPIEDPFLEGNNDVDDKILESADHSPASKESAALHVPETKEIENKGNKEDLENQDQPASPPMDTSKSKRGEVGISHENSTSVVIDMLKSAFQVVGCLPEQGELLSFAEAGNPVMTLAAFLAGLVGPDVAVNSTRGSLKAMSENSPSIQLAIRHCFLLEDTPNDKKDPPSDESVSANMDSGEVDKAGQGSTLAGANESKDFPAKNREIVVPVEKERDLSNSSQECTQVQPASDKMQDLDEMKGKTNDSGDPTLPNEQVSPNTEKNISDPALSEVLPPSNTKESADSALDADVTPSKPKEVNDVELAREDKPNSMEAGDVGMSNAVEQCSDTSKTADAVSTAAALEERESQQTAASGSTAENKDKAVEDDRNILPSKDEKDSDASETDDDHNIDRIRRAAVTALSAAAVKAKLLAKEEEEHILQLVALVIEKQLYKLENKLAFLTEMESVIMRVREQTDRARQRLFHERAQIIAARLGLPGSSARGNLPSIPTNKIAMNYSTTSARPPYMVSQKPHPLKRP